MIGKKRVWVYKDGVLYGKFESRIEAIYKCHVSYASITIIAEFVETEESKEALHEIDCDYYQGFLYSAARPLED